MDNYFSQQKRGGYIASKIEAQDSVAAILSLELMNKSSRYYKDFDSSDWKIICEGNDDLEVISDKLRIFVQVKTSEIAKKDFIQILELFLQNSKKSTIPNVRFKLCAFNNIYLDNGMSIEKFNEFQNAKGIYPPKEVDDMLNALLDTYKLDYKFKNVVYNLEIDIRPLFKDATDTVAIFADCLRRAYPIRDFGNSKISNIYYEITNEFSHARRNRSCVEKRGILNIINKNISVENIIGDVSIRTGYKKSDYGYLPDSDSRKKVSELQHSSLGIIRKIMQTWRKCYFKEFLKSFIIPAHLCPNCDHPLIANFNGLNGIACPDCGFNPYETLFLGCSCGHYEVIKTQPELSSDDFSNYILEFFKSKENSICPLCSKDLLDEYWEYKVFLLPVPYPLNNFDLKSLYDKALSEKPQNKE